MNGSEQKIEIFKPFGQAFDLMKKILFEPFDLTKWCVIGFAAFLASFSGGMNFNFSGFNRNRDWHLSYSSVRQNIIETTSHVQGWVIPLAIVMVIIVIAMVVVLIWLGARGRFIFTDCIVRNRGAIEEPWREFRTEGNSFFLFSLLSLAVIVIFGLPLFLLLILHGDTMQFGAALISGIVFLATFVLLLSFAWNLVSQLMVPVMYRRRCRSVAAFKEVIALIVNNPAPLILYFLFFIVLAIACAIIGCVAACLTCCIAAIPYVSSVILLPLYVTLYGFTLLFLQQFGPDYDVWAGILPIDQPPPPPPIEPPPLQT